MLECIPEDWEISDQDYNLLGYFSNMFDSYLTKEENTKISSALSNMETLNTERDLNELKQSYLVITDLSICKVCQKKL